MRRLLLALTAAIAACQPVVVPPAPLVYDSPIVRVRAGIADLVDGEPVRLGDIVTFVLRIDWDPATVTLTMPDERFFLSAWPESDQPVLYDMTETNVARESSHGAAVLLVYRFQLFDCPGDSRFCPGERSYRLPEFTLEFSPADKEKALQAPVTFQPWPLLLPVASTISLDNEGEVYAFNNYFPAGGYPLPLHAQASNALAAVAAGAGVATLAGILLMWPFSQRSNTAHVELPRWQRALSEMPDTAGDEFQACEALRRALVWYCNDELGIDAFRWLSDAPTPGDERDDLRAVFLDLLQPNGTSAAALHERVQSLLAVQTPV